MKRQLFALIAGAALLAAPLMTNIANADSAPRRGPGARMERLAKKLNLTEAQKSQLKALHQQKKARFKAILTPEQQQMLETARAERKAQWKAYRENGGERPRRRGGKRAMFKKLNLSDAQKAQMKQLRQEMKAARDEILTAEQKSQLEAMKQARRARRQQRRNSR